MTQNTQISFWTLDQISVWLDTPSSAWLDDLAVGGASLIERLCNDITAPDQASLDQAFGLAERLVARLAEELNDAQSPIHSKLAVAFSILTNFIIEAGLARFEAKPSLAGVPELLDRYRALRGKLVQVAHQFFGLSVFEPIRDAVNQQIIPFLDSLTQTFDGQDNHYLGFRVLTMAGISEQLRLIQVRISADEQPELYNLLSEIYRYKYVRFGTSGYRGVWGRDFTPELVRVVTQSICDYLKTENMPTFSQGMGADVSGKVIVIGYDGRRNSAVVARMVAEVALANGFQIYFGSRPSPTPALNFFAREYIGAERLAGLVNCTASHNPPEWQGIKFNPSLGYPAPSSLTDIIASRSNIRHLLGTEIPTVDSYQAETEQRFIQFDPRNLYLNYLRESGHGNNRLSVNFDNIKKFFGDKQIILDSMYGSGDGYLSKILGELGVPHQVLHDERDEDLGLQTEVIRGIPHLEYANPEPDSIQPLIDKVIASNATIGLGVDTDADRFGIVDRDGVYIRPNQVLAMLTRYLGVERGETGRVVITQTGLPMISALAQRIPNNEKFCPPAGSVPGYVSHPFYQPRVGKSADIQFGGVYVVPVGIKNVIDVARVADGVTDPAKSYVAQSDREMPADWMDRLLIGGEESSGLTTRGHVPDKDGVWANLLVLDLLAYYGLKYDNPNLTLTDIWNETIQSEGAWNTTGGRIDLDVAQEVKVGILNYYLDLFKGWKEGDAFPQLAGLEVYYAGGTRYDFVELFLKDEKFGAHHFLRVRASGTEPILRVYAESEDETILNSLFDTVLEQIDGLNVASLDQSYSEIHLGELLTNTRFAETTINATKALIVRKGWSTDAVIQAMEALKPHIDGRNGRLTDQWIAELR